MFYAEKCKMLKLQFLVTKSDQIPNLMSGKTPRPPKSGKICGGFHLSESSSDERNIAVDGGGKNGRLSQNGINLKDFVSERS